MDTVWLLDFEALIAQKNFSRAAEERNVSQPAFSRRIRALEEGVGATLINRQTLPLSLTPAGEVFRSQARLILRTWQETLDRCQTVEAAGESVIRFATSQSLYMTHYQELIAHLVANSGLETDLNSTSWGADQFVTAIQQQYCDIILTYWHPAMDVYAPLGVGGTEYLVLKHDEFVPVSKTGADGPLFTLEPQRERSVPLLSYGTASALRAVAEYALRQNMVSPKILMVNQNTQATSVKAMILQGFGFGWLPKALCAEELADGRLQIIGNERHICPLEIRVYRSLENQKKTLNNLWDKLKEDIVARTFHPLL